jgi:hypothetical protein
MSITVPVLDKSDPRQDKWVPGCFDRYYLVNVERWETDSRLMPYHLPFTPEWDEKKDIFGQSAMMGAGAGMFIKNPLWVYVLGLSFSRL